MTITQAVATGTYVIRQARPEEYDAVGRLTYEGFGHHLPGAHQPDEERLGLLLDAAARAREGVLLVAEDQETGRLVGTATTPVSPRRARAVRLGEGVRRG